MTSPYSLYRNRLLKYAGHYFVLLQWLEVFNVIVCLHSYMQSLLTHLVHNSFHLHNIPDDKCSRILPWCYCSKHWHCTYVYFRHIRQYLYKVYGQSMIRNFREMQTLKVILLQKKEDPNLKGSKVSLKCHKLCNSQITTLYDDSTNTLVMIMDTWSFPQSVTLYVT